MPFQALNRTLPGLSDYLKNLSALNNSEELWQALRRLLLAHAPSGGANLLGGIGDDIAVLADGLGLRDRTRTHFGSTGDMVIWLGAEKAADVVIVSHMDRPSFRVQSLEDGLLYPISANRFPAGEYRVAAKAVRFQRGRLLVSAAGMLISHKTDTSSTLHFEAKRGKLGWQDTILLDVNPVCSGGNVMGSGLDNCLGVLTTLLAAAALKSIESLLVNRDRRCLFVFTDQEEGPPDAFFGHGAARLTHALPPPTYGCIVVDAHTAGPGLTPQLSGGASHGLASSWGRGSIVPPNFQSLAVELAEGMNEAYPGTVQINSGYLSRSDDMILSQWTRILALIGPPMTDPHTGYEAARLSDIQSSVWWLTYFVAATLNLVPELTPRYALGR
jgi:putative aminopeptidase FrvX